MPPHWHVVYRRDEARTDDDLMRQSSGYLDYPAAENGLFIEIGRLSLMGYRYSTDGRRGYLMVGARRKLWEKPDHAEVCLVECDRPNCLDRRRSGRHGELLPADAPSPRSRSVGEHSRP